MKSHNVLFRIALLVFLTLSISACTQSNISFNETPVQSVDMPTGTTQPLPTTSQPSPSPTPNTTWRVLAFENAQVYLLAMDPLDSRIIYAGVIQNEHDRLLKSLDGGQTWSILMQFPEIPYNWHYRGLAINPHDPNVLYTAVYDQGMFKSTDGGEIWKPINSGLIDYTFGTLTISSSKPETLYTSSLYGAFTTSDGGQHWQNINEGFPKNVWINALVIDPQNSTTVFAGTKSGLYKTTDGGQTWRGNNGGLYIKVGSMHESEPTWINTIVFQPHDPNTLYLGGYGVFKSTNGGASWKAVNEGLDYNQNGVASHINYLSIDPNLTRTIYGVRGESTVYRSDDFGATWALFDQGLNTTWLEGAYTQVLIDHTDSDILYVGTRKHGLYTTRLSSLPTTTPTATPYECTGGWTQLKVNTYAKISGDEGDLPNRVREEAHTQSEIIYQLYPGEIVKLIEGPFCTDNLVFWKVEHANIPGGAGWTAEGDLNEYWLEPYITE